MLGTVCDYQERTSSSSMYQDTVEILDVCTMTSSNSLRDLVTRVLMSGAIRVRIVLNLTARELSVGCQWAFFKKLGIAIFSLFSMSPVCAVHDLDAHDSDLL
jgi:hypothetical protein